MNITMIRGFSDELEKIAFMANVGTKIVNTIKPVGKYLQKGWNAGGWMGAGKQGPGAFESVTSLGGLTKHLPVGNKSLTVGFGALQAKDAIKKEDPTGQGRSRAERMGSLVGGTAAGLAGMNMGLVGGMATGIGGDIVGGKLGKLVGGKRRPPPAAQTATSNPQAVVPNAPQPPTNG